MKRIASEVLADGSFDLDLSRFGVDEDTKVDNKHFGD
jgi:hypothetical protein